MLCDCQQSAKYIRECESTQQCCVGGLCTQFWRPTVRNICALLPVWVPQFRQAELDLQFNWVTKCAQHNVNCVDSHQVREFSHSLLQNHRAQLDKQPTKNCGLLYNQLALLLIYCAPRPAMRGDGTQSSLRSRSVFAYANPHNNVVLAQ